MTIYCVRYRLRSVGTMHERSFDSMTQRALFVLQLEPYADVLTEWLGTR